MVNVNLMVMEITFMQNIVMVMIFIKMKILRNQVISVIQVILVEVNLVINCKVLKEIVISLIEKN